MPDAPLIAVVDDDASIRNATQDLLKAAGYEVASFPDSTSFLDHLSHGRVACLVADLRMPGMTGLQLHEHLAMRGAGIPTVIITAHPGELSRERVFEAGDVCLLAKPFAPDALLDCVRKVMGQVCRTIPRS